MVEDLSTGMSMLNSTALKRIGGAIMKAEVGKILLIWLTLLVLMALFCIPIAKAESYPCSEFHSLVVMKISSRERMRLSYIDLYLIHWPVEGLRNETWKAMEKLQEEGKCRAVGVSNYMIWHLEKMLSNPSIIPAVNQVEFSPYLYLKDLLDFCRSHDILLESYSPLTKGVKLNDPKLLAIASKYSKTAAQILIRWILQHDIVVIPKSSRKERIEENADVFDFTISEEDMRTLDSFHEDLRTSWDPTSVP